jgi:hypothetical protein
VNAEVLSAYEDMLSTNGWTRSPRDPDSLIVQWRHPTLLGSIHLSIGEYGKGWRHYIAAPFPHVTGADVDSLSWYLASAAMKNPSARRHQ